MKLQLFSAVFFLVCMHAHAQLLHTGDLTAPAEFENLHKQDLFSDERVTSVALWIKSEVKLHRHEAHSEHVIVLKGKGEMRLGDKTFPIAKGDFIFIPQGTPHAVRVTKGPLKVISVQAPMFDGKDRVMME